MGGSKEEEAVDSNEEGRRVRRSLLACVVGTAVNDE